MDIAEGVPALDEEKAVQLIEILEKKLTRAQRQIAGLREKSKYLEMQYDDAKVRESNSSELVMELIERQHELNVMLNRAQTMLSRTQEAMALTSLEFNEMAKALPEPKKAEFSDRITKINELFKKTGVEDADLAIEKPSDEQESDEAEETIAAEEATPEDTKTSRWDSFWKRKQPHTPQNVQADLVDDPSAISSAEA
jgi:hypothetical protein